MHFQETKRQLEETRAELAAERSAHDATKQALKRESEQREVVLAAAVAAPAAAAVAAAVPPSVGSHPISSPIASPHKLSPREAAEVRQQVLDLEVSSRLMACGLCFVCDVSWSGAAAWAVWRGVQGANLKPIQPAGSRALQHPGAA